MDLASQRNRPRGTDLAIAFGWLAVLLAAVFSYWPGLRGPFVLDDIGTISALGSFGGVNDWESFKAFVFHGTAGPTGRPVALLSFLVDGNNWPTDPAPFKRSNLLIHMINGGLLGFLTGRILVILEFDKRRAQRVALVAAACWMMHPFLVSTTLYVVQRMAQLSTLFVFAGLLGHLYGRSLLSRDSRRAYITMSLSLISFTLLATLSKENGILLPLLVGVMEITVVASRGPGMASLDKRWAGLFIFAPAIAVLVLIGTKGFGPSFFEIVPPRDFSLYERALTQPRILADYLQHWFIPSLYTTGVFQDHFIKSTGLFTPMSTALCILLHFAIIVMSIAWRRRAPLFAFAALFFYSSHLLESTILNLELYFEHRNYLAAAFLFLPVIAFLESKINRRLFVVTAVGILLVLGSFTRFSATIWQDFEGMVEASAHKAPTSARAQGQYATLLFNAQRYEESLQVLDQAIQNIPGDNPLLLVNRIIILCNLGILDRQEFKNVAATLSGIVYDARSIKLYTSFTNAVADDRCPDVAMDSLRSMYQDMLGTEHNGVPDTLEFSHLKYFVGLTNMHLHEPQRAVAAFEESLRAEAGAEHAMAMAAQMASKGFYDEALYLSELALEQLGAGRGGVSQGTPVSESSVRAFQTVVRADIEALRSGEGN